LLWEELVSGLLPSDFTIKTVRARLDRIGDLWSGILGPGVEIERTLPALQALWGGNPTVRKGA
jgi:bifunctional non-homologous end joining protein LigD